MSYENIKEALQLISDTRDVSCASVRVHPMPTRQQVQYINSVCELAEAGLQVILSLEAELSEAQDRARRLSCGARLAYGALSGLVLDPSDPVHAVVIRARRDLDLCLTYRERTDARLNELERIKHEGQ